MTLFFIKDLRGIPFEFSFFGIVSFPKFAFSLTLGGGGRGKSYLCILTIFFPKTR